MCSSYLFCYVYQLKHIVTDGSNSLVHQGTYPSASRSFCRSLRHCSQTQLPQESSKQAQVVFSNYNPTSATSSNQISCSALLLKLARAFEIVAGYQTLWITLFEKTIIGLLPFLRESTYFLYFYQEFATN